MSAADLEGRIKERGRALFAAIAGEKPSLFSAATWTGAIMARAMACEEFKVRLFRFVDVFPSLRTDRQVSDHFRQYFGDLDDLPSILAKGAALATRLGPLGDAVLARGISANIHEMARQFIIGETTAEAVRRLTDLRRAGFAAVVDVLGEATLSDAEAAAYAATYGDLLDAMQKAQERWPTLAGKTGDPRRDWGDTPRINVAVKPTALFPLANPMDFEGSVVGILARLRPLCAATVAAGGFLCIDMESYRFKDITLEVYRRLKTDYRDYPHIGIVLQAYLNDTDHDLAALLSWAERHENPVSVRLVKGAYWDYETVRAAQSGWPPPVRVDKTETDAAFERLAETILRNHHLCHFA